MYPPGVLFLSGGVFVRGLCYIMRVWRYLFYLSVVHLIYEQLSKMLYDTRCFFCLSHVGAGCHPSQLNRVSACVCVWASVHGVPYYIYFYSAVYKTASRMYACMWMYCGTFLSPPQHAWHNICTDWSGLVHIYMMHKITEYT